MTLSAPVIRSSPSDVGVFKCVYYYYYYLNDLIGYAQKPGFETALHREGMSFDSIVALIPLISFVGRDIQTNIEEFKQEYRNAMDENGRIEGGGNKYLKSIYYRIIRYVRERETPYVSDDTDHMTHPKTQTNNNKPLYPEIREDNAGETRFSTTVRLRKTAKRASLNGEKQEDDCENDSDDGNSMTKTKNQAKSGYADPVQRQERGDYFEETVFNIELARQLVKLDVSTRSSLVWDEVWYNRISKHLIRLMTEPDREKLAGSFYSILYQKKINVDIDHIQEYFTNKLKEAQDILEHMPRKNFCLPEELIMKEMKRMSKFYYALILNNPIMLQEHQYSTNTRVVGRNNARRGED